MKNTIQCPKCFNEIDKEKLLMNLSVCPSCNYHHRIDLVTRLNQICDKDSFVEYYNELTSINILDLEGYDEKLLANQKKSKLKDAIVTGSCTIENNKTLIAIMSFDFMGGSMGALVGEKLTKLFLKGIEDNLPVIVFTASGGARMQEGIFSLMQMAKTSSAIALMHECNIPLFIVLTHPTTGGVTASFAMLGDIILSEPNTLIGFAGPRVIAGTIGQKLPDDFQTAEFQKNHGFIDKIVERKKLRSTLSFLLKTHKGN